jgi:hypothetical protein|tara:strand:+ start:116 stop:247 length:132 start_codon:yes stop_codon:yes gene_type:complete
MPRRGKGSKFKNSIRADLTNISEFSEDDILQWFKKIAPQKEVS